MSCWKILAYVFSSFGFLLLFTSWAVQQIVLQDTIQQLQRWDAAEVLYETFRSNDGLFQAIIISNPKLKAHIEDIRDQFKDFGRHYYDTLTRDVQSVPMEGISLELHAEIERNSLLKRSDEAYWSFISLYIVGTVAVLLAMFFKCAALCLVPRTQ
jgi:hypothetical protein